MEQPKADVFSTKQTMRLLSLNVKSYAGIDHTHDLVITFPPDKNITGFVGDNGVGKTSALRAVLTLLGYEEPANALNGVDKNKKAELTFIKDGNTYTVNQTKTSFSVTVERENGEKSTLKSPKEALTNIIGNVTLSPMDLKNLSGKKQIEWLRGAMKWSEEALEMQEQIKTGRKAAYDQRTKENKAVADLKTELINSGFFYYDKENNELTATDKCLQEADELKKYASDEATVNANFVKADADRVTYNKAELRVAQINDDISAQNRTIERLRQELLLAETKLTELQGSLQKGRTYLDENKDCLTNFDKAQKEMMEFSEIKGRRQVMQRMDGQLDTFNKSVEETTNLTIAIDKWDEAMKELIKTLTPDVPGLEVVLGENIDNTKEEGIYYNGRSMAECCETEMWEWFVPFLQKTNTGAIIIENVTSLGTKAVEVINNCAKEGVYVFYSAMQRDTNALKVEFLDVLK